MKRIAFVVALLAVCGAAVWHVMLTEPPPTPKLPPRAKAAPKQPDGPKGKRVGQQPKPKPKVVPLARPFTVAKLEAALVALTRLPPNEARFTEGARLRSWLAQYHPDKKTRLKHAIAGLRDAQLLEQVAPKDAGGPYWHAMTLGLWLQHHPLRATTKVRVIEKLARKSVEMDPSYYHAGAHRFLGHLYREAPRFLVSRGPASRSQRHYEAAAKLAPGFPENRINVAEFVAGRGSERRREHARAAVKLLEAMQTKGDVQLQEQLRKARQLSR